MNQSEASDRIRQVAIVLTSVDASTARRILGQLPASQGRMVRQKMANLGTVTSAERQAAMHSFMLLTQSKPSAKNIPDNSQKSPAEALLSNTESTIDRIEISQDAISQAESLPNNNAERSSFNDFQPVNGSSPNPFQPPLLNSAWQQWSGGDLARMLMNERPNVIAALILQCPNELAASILEALPSQTASDVLAALPQLASTDPYLLQEIYDVLHTRLVDFQRQSNPANAGLTKLQAILGNLSNDHRHRIRNALSQSQPMLAHSLGLKPNPDHAVAVTSPNVEENAPSVPSQSTSYRSSAEVGNDEIADFIVPFSTTSSNDSPSSEVGELAFENLNHFSPEELAIVLRSLDPETILLAVSGASSTMRTRIESLIAPDEVTRLRKRLRSLRRISNQEKMAAQQKIVQMANQLLQQGHIAGYASVAYVAA
jgi:flagellar motor switch protein FliG